MEKKIYFPHLKQPQKGYRYNIDSFFLARFAQLKKTDRVCDLGAGVGILGVLAIQRYQVAHVTAVEIQGELAQFARDNIAELGLEKNMELWEMDWADLSKKKPKPKFDVVLSNPPYRPLHGGRLPPRSFKAIARHEVHGKMSDLLEIGKQILKPEGRFYLLYPVLRLEELLQNFKTVKLKAQRIVFIHPFADRAATHFMVQAVTAPTRELQVETPLIVYRDLNHYTAEVEQWVGKKYRR
jgi:tRNA1(Val) A37 N6-methylase TrmN6